MRLLNFTIIKLTLFLVIGIILGYFFPLSIRISVIISIALFLIAIVLHIVSNKTLKKSRSNGIVILLLTLSIGNLTVSTHNQKNFKKHYSHFISPSNDSLTSVTFRIKEVLKPGQYYDKYIVDILEADSINVKGKSLLNIKKDSVASTLVVDEIFIAPINFKELIPPLNPGQFDYKSYLEKQYIYHQIFISQENLFPIENKSVTLFGLADRIRNHINSKLGNYNFHPDELAIINALLMGQRQDISKEIYSDYTNAGAIHILAVSGLHVGIILLILTTLLKPLEQFKNGRLIKMTLIVSFLWCFAIIAGLSASVTRAVAMFSILAFALNLKRPTNTYNTLAISVFVILLFKPLFLFDVGFQLSYLAVIAIVALDPILYKLWQPKFWLIDKLWHILTITISAQFGIIPISLYYFHQFPGLFFISNLVIIPFLGLILGIGLLVILLSVFGILPQFVADFYGRIINYMNTFVGWVSSQEGFLIKDIAFNLIYVIVSYLLIISTVRFLTKRNYKRVSVFLISIILFQAAFFITDYKKPENQFIVFHKSRHTVLGNVAKNSVTVYNNSDSISKASISRIITNYRVSNHISNIKMDSISSLLPLGNKNLLIVDSLGVYNVKQFKPEYMLLRESPKINLNRLIDSLKPKQIIADGSNYKSYVEQWKSICVKRKIPFHNTNEKGAYILEY